MGAWLRGRRQVLILAAVFVVAILLTAVLVWPTGSKTQLTTEAGGPTTTDASIADPSTTFESVTSDDVASATTASASDRKPAGPRPTTAPAASESLVPAGFQRFLPGGSAPGVGIARYDFSDQRRLFTYPEGSTPGYYEAWSPTRDRIALSYCTSERCTVRTVSIDGKLSEPLGEGVLTHGHVWSPDGRWLTVQKGPFDAEQSLVSTTGETQRKVGGGSSEALAWSPDSKQIAYAKDGVLHIAHADGSNDRTFPDPMRSDTSREVTGAAATWAPNGHILAVRRAYFVKGQDSDNPWRRPTPTVATLDPDTGTWHELGDWEAGEWTHDSSELIVRVPKYWDHVIGARGCPGETETAAIDVRTGAKRGFGVSCRVDLSPDGSWVYVAESNRVRVVPVAGTDPEGRVVYEPDEQHPKVAFDVNCCDWSPGSDAVVVFDHGTVIRIDGRGRWDPPRAS